MEDFNAKIGREERLKSVTGGNSKHEKSNGNGKKLIEFALEERKKIISTDFKHKSIYKCTWKSPTGDTVNQIDHMLIDKKVAWQKGSIKDVRSYRGADASSDLYLVKVKMREVRSERRATSKSKMTRLNKPLLAKTESKNTFVDKLEQGLGDEGITDIEKE